MKGPQIMEFKWDTFSYFHIFIFSGTFLELKGGGITKCRYTLNEDFVFSTSLFILDN